MKQFFLQLSLRERLLLGGGLSVLAVSGLYAYTYLPIVDGRQRLNAAITAQQQLQSQLQGISAEVAALPSNVTTTADNTQSLIGIIDAGSEQSGLKTAIKRLIPEGQDKVTLWLEQCDFDTLLAWLVRLDQEHAITVQQINISRAAGDAGLVSGKVLLGY